jgi:hypothetical protein
MALIDRIFRDDVDPTRWIHNHEFSAAVWFWSKGEITRQDVINSFGLDATDEIQLDELATHYGTLTADEKSEWHSDLEAAGILAESGRITKAKYKSLLGLT